MSYNFKAKEDLIDFISSEVLTTSEVIELLDCSRQYVNQLVNQGKLVSIKRVGNTTLFFKPDVLTLVTPKED